MRFSCFPVLPGSAEAHVIWGCTVKRLLIAYFIGNISAKNIRMRSRMSKLQQIKGGTFLEIQSRIQVQDCKCISYATECTTVLKSCPGVARRAGLVIES